LDPSLAYRTLIPCNIYGRHDTFDPARSHLVSAIIAKVEAARRSGQTDVEIWGDGSVRREFMYAGDFADAVWRATTDMHRLPLLMNIGVGADHTILDYYQTVAAVVGWSGQFRFDLSKPVGMRRKLNDVTLQREWGWMPSTSLEAGIRYTHQYFMEKEG
jgi:GDP-L-fucose synthase